MIMFGTYTDFNGETFPVKVNLKENACGLYDLDVMSIIKLKKEINDGRSRI